ncbi:Insecticidal toxin complex protein [Bizionia sp. KMM 8389]
MSKLWLIFLCMLPFLGQGAEWRSLKSYQKETGRLELSAADWLRCDRTQQTNTWILANQYNLENQNPTAYRTIAERRDFYAWYALEITEKGHPVVWPKMAHYISIKLRLTQAFPFTIFIKKHIQAYAYQGSEMVFNQVFPKLKNLYVRQNPLTEEEALLWDKTVLYSEQYEWLEGIYETMSEENLKTIGKMAKGKGVYGLIVPKSIEFKGAISDKNIRYQYALTTLREFCKNKYK